MEIFAGKPVPAQRRVCAEHHELAADEVLIFGYADSGYARLDLLTPRVPLIQPRRIDALAGRQIESQFAKPLLELTVTIAATPY